MNLHALHDDYDAEDNRYFNAKPLALTPGTDAPTPTSSTASSTTRFMPSTVHREAR